MVSSNFFGQSFTLITSYCISSLPSGNRSGSTLQRNWYAMSLNGLTSGRTLARTQTLLTLCRFVNCSMLLFAQLAILPQASLPKLRNVFDDLPSLRAFHENKCHDDLACYLMTDPQAMDDVLMWWHEHSAMYSHLSQMALDYLTIPGESCSFQLQGNFLVFIAAMSVDVERVLFYFI